MVTTWLPVLAMPPYALRTRMGNSTADTTRTSTSTGSSPAVVVAASSAFQNPAALRLATLTSRTTVAMLFSSRTATTSISRAERSTVAVRFDWQRALSLRIVGTYPLRRRSMGPPCARVLAQRTRPSGTFPATPRRPFVRGVQDSSVTMHYRAVCCWCVGTSFLRGEGTLSSMIIW